MATILNNSATLTYNSGTDTGTAASNVVSTNLLDSYSITAEKYTANNDWRPGENITYLVTITNTGTQPLYAVEVIDDLGGTPTLTNYLTGSALIVNDSSVTEVTPTDVNPLTIPVVAVLQPGESVTVVYVTRVNGTIGDNVDSITNTATVQARQDSATGEIFTADPAPSVTIPRADFAEVSIVKAVDKTTVISGDTLTYTFTIENTGNIPATNVVITDVLPEGFTITSIVFQSEGITTVYGPDDYTVGADNTLILPTGTLTLTVPASSASGAGVTVVTITGTVTG